MGRVPLLLALSLLAAPAWADVVGRVSTMEGTASKKTADGHVVELEEDSGVSAGDHLTTGDKSRLEVVFADGSVLRVGPKSELDVTELAFQPESQTLTAKFHLFLGKVWSHVEKLKPEGKYEVETERAVAGVRGTEFRVDADSKTEGGVEVYEGKVHVLDNAIAMRETPMPQQQYGMAGPNPNAPPQASRQPSARAGAGVAERAAGTAKPGLNLGGEPALKEAIVEPGHRVSFERDGLRVAPAREADDFGKWASRELPKKERLFNKHGERAPESREHEKRKQRHERRQERRERMRSH